MSAALVVTWGGGGNLPPLLDAARLLAARGVEVEVLASAASAAEARRRGFATQVYGSAPDPDLRVAFEAQAERLMRQAAGVEVARDVLELVSAVDLLVADCMLPAALAAGEAAGVPTVSLVHFPYALARSAMGRGAGAWTTDRGTLDATRRELGLPATTGDVQAWESPNLLLATLPRWFDAPGELPPHVVHAGPLGVRTDARAGHAHRALLSFSTTVMEGQPRLVAAACAAVERAGIDGLLTLGPALDRSPAAGSAAVEVVEWADHDDAMAGCELVITHGGLGTTLRALAHGRPMVLLPLGRDQHFNAQRVEALGAGVRLRQSAEPDEIAAAIDRVLADRAFAGAARRCRERIAAERPDDAAARALVGLTT
jgi:UDP:flavonoid glycosyltransferase YjiC (YdhE family)